MIKKLIILIILAAIGFVGYKGVTRTLINSTLQMDIKQTDPIQHSLLDDQAKKEMLLLYNDTNGQLYELARASKSYWAYELGKTRILADQNKKVSDIMSAYRKRKQKAF